MSPSLNQARTVSFRRYHPNAARLHAVLCVHGRSRPCVFTLTALVRYRSTCGPLVRKTRRGGGEQRPILGVRKLHCTRLFPATSLVGAGRWSFDVFEHRVMDASHCALGVLFFGLFSMCRGLSAGFIPPGVVASPGCGAAPGPGGQPTDHARLQCSDRPDRLLPNLDCVN